MGAADIRFYVVVNNGRSILPTHPKVNSLKRFNRQNQRL